MNQDYLDCVGGYEPEEAWKIIHQSGSLSGANTTVAATETVDFQDLFGHELSAKDAARFFGASSMRTNQQTDGKPEVDTRDVHFLNPVLSAETKLFRNGLLQAIRQNTLDVSSQLRYSYLTDQEAIQRGMNLGALAKLRKIRDKLVDIYKKYGGHENSLKRAMLTGTGNAYNNHVPVNIDNTGIYSDQQEYDILNSPYSPFDIWDSLSARLKDFVLAIYETLKQVTGLFVASNGKPITSTLLGDIPAQGEFVTGEEPSTENGKTTSAVDTPKDDKNIIEQAVDWISENPITTVAVVGGIGLLIKIYLDKRKEQGKGLSGLIRGQTQTGNRTGRSAVRKKRRTSRKTKSTQHL